MITENYGKENAGAIAITFVLMHQMTSGYSKPIIEYPAARPAL